MNWLMEVGSGRMSMTSKVLLFGVILLFPLFPFIWLAVRAFGPDITWIFAIGVEVLVAIAMISIGVQMRSRQEQRQAALVASALRRAPIN